MNKIHALVIALSVIVLAGCGSTGVLQTGPETYRIARKSSGGVFADMKKLQAEVIAEANAFAESKGKIAVPIMTDMDRPAAFGMPEVEYYFKLEDPHARAPQMGTPAPARDIYAELEKLETLRKNGVLTEEEFTDQKAKILARE